MFKIRLADVTIEIDNRYGYVFSYCKNYLCDGFPNFRISVSEKEIRNYISQAEYDVDEPHAECLLICRAITAKLPEYGWFLFHSAVVSCPECSVAFSAPRGVGKTTHANLWKKVFGERAVIISGDKPIVGKADGKWVAYSTPWNGKEGIGKRASTVLDAVVFLEQANENSIRKIDSVEFAERLSEQVIYPTECDLQDRFANLAADMIKKVPAFVLKCNISDEAVKTVYRAVTGKNINN